MKISAKSMIFFVIILFSFSIKAQDKNEMEYFKQGINSNNEKDYERAIESFNHVIKINPLNAAAYYQLGLAYSSINNVNKAKKSFLKAIETGFKNENSKIYFNAIGMLYATIDEPDDVFKVLNEMDNIDIDWYNVCFGLALVLEKRNVNEALKYYEKGLSYNKDTYKFLTTIGSFYWNKKKDLKAAFKYFQLSIKENDKYAKTYSAMGEVYMDTEEYAKAIKCFEDAISLDPKFALAFYNMGMTYGMMGNNRKAVESIRKASDLGADYAKEWLKETGNESK